MRSQFVPGHFGLTAGFLLLFFLVSCASDAGDATTNSVGPSTATIAYATPQATLRATSSPAESLPVPADTIVPPPSPTSVQTSTPSGSTIATSPATAAPPSPTLQPTFTPPPPPPPVEGEQLWLGRPVPPSAPSWTDKSYPYGSTRGGSLRPHTGVEFGVPTGTPVLAVAPGTVLVAGNDSQTAYGPTTDFYGNLVILELDTTGATPVYALYGHLSEVSVTVGQRVAMGDVLGLSGATGVADGPHLHFEVRVGQNLYSATRNPLLWLTPLPGTGVVAGRIVNTSGELLHEAPVSLIRVDAPSTYASTTSYALGDPNGDDTMNENFAIDDVAGGFYEAVVDAGNKRFTANVWVYPNRVNWIEIVVGP